MTPYHLRPKPPESRGAGVPADQGDGKYWPMIDGQAFDPRDVDEREQAFETMKTWKEE